MVWINNCKRGRNRYGSTGRNLIVDTDYARFYICRFFTGEDAGNKNDLARKPALRMCVGAHCSEPPGLDDRFCALSCATGFANHLWTDAYLAVFAMVGNCRLVSFDGDFKRFSGQDFLPLNA